MCDQQKTYIGDTENFLLIYARIKEKITPENQFKPSTTIWQDKRTGRSLYNAISSENFLSVLEAGLLLSGQ